MMKAFDASQLLLLYWLCPVHSGWDLCSCELEICSSGKSECCGLSGRNTLKWWNIHFTHTLVSIAILYKIRYISSDSERTQTVAWECSFLVCSAGRLADASLLSNATIFREVLKGWIACFVKGIVNSFVMSWVVLGSFYGMKMSLAAQHLRSFYEHFVIPLSPVMFVNYNRFLEYW
jgi:hypothetical protein